MYSPPADTPVRVTPPVPWLNVAVTVVAALIATVHVVPETVLHPLQLANVDPPAALAVRVTLVPLSYGSEQSAPQLIPAGLEVTVPLPLPVLVTVSTKRGGSKVAVTVFAAFMVTVHVAPETVLQPLQPANVDPPEALAVRVTLVPLP